MEKANKPAYPLLFTGWKALEVEDKYDLSRTPDSDPEVQSWYNAAHAIPAEFIVYFQKLREVLRYYVTALNEQELRDIFISPVLGAVLFVGRGYHPFSNRPMKLTGPDGLHKISGEADWLVAKGSTKPETPSFFFHEYKRQTAFKADPQAQALLAMLAGQEENQDGGEVYGCFVIGRAWTFIYLREKKIWISEEFDASSEREFAQIWSLLVEVKNRIDAKVNAA